MTNTNVKVTYEKNGTKYSKIVQVGVVNQVNVEMAMLKHGVGRSAIKSYNKSAIQPRN